jgi:hypothetical protein
VTANASTGALRTPSTFFTANAAALSSALSLATTYQPLDSDLTAYSSAADAAARRLLISAASTADLASLSGTFDNFTGDPSTAPGFLAGTWRAELDLTSAATGDAAGLVTGTVASARLPTATSTDLGVIRLSGASTASISAAGNTTITLAAAQPNSVATITAAAGAGGYTHQIILSSTNAHAGAFVTVHVDLAASNNPRIELRNLTAGGTILGEAVGNGTARRVTLRCIFDGTNWSLVSRLPTVETYDFDRDVARAAGVTGSAGAWTWTPPVGYRRIELVGVGPGGGGGSGRRGASGSNRFGGGGGGGGGYAVSAHGAEEVGTGSLQFTLPAGGAGGAAQGNDSTHGNAGVAGGTALVHASVSGVRLFQGAGGAAGGGGTDATGSGGAALSTVSQTMLPSGDGRAGGTGVGTGGGGSYGPAGAGAGGGLAASDTPANGGSGGRANVQSHTASLATAGVAPGGNGGHAALSTSLFDYGSSGAGGASAVAGAAGAGGNGIRGGGGGGGGAAQNGFASGAGGNGGAAFVQVRVYY